MVGAWRTAMSLLPWSLARYVGAWWLDLAARLATIFFVVEALQQLSNTGATGSPNAVIQDIIFSACFGSLSAVTARLVVRLRYAIAIEVSVHFFRSTTATIAHEDGSDDFPGILRPAPIMDSTRFHLDAFSVPLRLTAAFVYLVTITMTYPPMLIALAAAVVPTLPIWARLLRSRRTMLDQKRDHVGQLADTLRKDGLVNSVWLNSIVRKIFWIQEAESQNASLSILMQALAISATLVTLLVFPPDDLLATIAASLFLFRLAASEIGQALHEAASAARFAASLNQLLKGKVFGSEAADLDSQ